MILFLSFFLFSKHGGEMIGGQRLLPFLFERGRAAGSFPKKNSTRLVDFTSLSPFSGANLFFLLVPILHINKVSRGDPFCFLGGDFLGASALPKPPHSAHPPATLFFLVFSRVCGERSTHLGFLLFYIYLVLGGCKMIGNFLDQASK